MLTFLVTDGLSDNGLQGDLQLCSLEAVGLVSVYCREDAWDAPFFFLRRGRL